MGEMMGKLKIMTEEQLEQLVKERLEKVVQDENAVYEREILLKQANLVTLQSQINPHFLYNTLECIRGMALIEGVEDIANIAWSLSTFFRYSISSKSDMVTIWDEIENVKNYVTIQQYRFKDRFQLEIKEEKTVMDAVIPKLTLQPAVENAIIHGLADITFGGKITVIVRRVDDNIQILVSDNGRGMSPEELERLCLKFRDKKMITGQEDNHHTGIGLQNVDRRLKLYFGPDYGLSIQSCLDIGTDVELLFPYRLTVKGT